MFTSTELCRALPCRSETFSVLPQTFSLIFSIDFRMIFPFISLIPSLVYGQMRPDCPLPVQTDCMVKNSQYTVVGTIQSISIGTNSFDTPQRYSAMMLINCVW